MFTVHRTKIKKIEKGKKLYAHTKTEKVMDHTLNGQNSEMLPCL
jgi:hypothetical protein